MALMWQDIAYAALRNIKVIAPGEIPAAAEMADLLVSANALLGSLSTQALPIPFLTPVSITMTGAQSYAVPTRPLKIEAAQVQLTVGVSQDVRIVPPEEWNAFSDKTQTGAYADILWWDALYPNSQVWLAPMPRTGGTLLMQVYMPLTSIVAWTDTFAYPPGYDRAMISLLALEAAPQFGAQVDQVMMSLAQDAKTSIQGLNQAVLGAPNPIVPGAPPVAQNPPQAQATPAQAQ